MMRQKKIAVFLKSAINKSKEANPQGNSGNSAADEITKLKSLLDDGVLTQYEFDQEKRKLLEM